MDRAPNAVVDSLNALELRVLQGPQAGARAPLAAGEPIVIATAAMAADADADIVLRDTAAAARVRVSVQAAQARLEVLAGETMLGGRALAAGAVASWRRHVPLVLGATTVAWGLACEDHWPEAGDDAAATSAGAAAAAPAGLAAGTAGRRPLRRRAEVWLAATGAGVLIACAGSLWMAHVAAAPRPAPAAPQPSFEQALAASEFAMLQATKRPDGRVELRGRLETLTQRARLDLWLAAQRTTPVLDVVVDEAVVREVTEVFRVNGVAVQARRSGQGGVLAEAAEPDAARLARAEEAVRRDVRGLERLELRNSAKPLPPPVAPVADDPNKRIASLVPGDPAYVVTVDGARYFVGAMLPSGWRLAEVARGRVTLERDGHVTTLQF